MRSSVVNRTDGLYAATSPGGFAAMDAWSETARTERSARDRGRRNGAASQVRARQRRTGQRPAGERRKGSVQDRVYAQLRHWLMVGRFLPGETITLRNLAAELKVSPMPVRAALRHLIAEGGLEMLPNRSVRVPRMTRERLAELLAVRRELEGLATAQACRAMTDAEFRAIAKLHASLMRALKAGNSEQVLALNQRFHFTLYTVARSWVIMPMIEALWLRAGPFMHLAQSSPGVRWDGRHHVELVRALARRDAKAARRAIQRDIGMAGQNLRATPLLQR
jgi:DNA-binding GntR family transcriptional regulator